MRKGGTARKGKKIPPGGGEEKESQCASMEKKTTSRETVRIVTTIHWIRDLGENRWIEFAKKYRGTPEEIEKKAKEVRHRTVCKMREIEGEMVYSDGPWRRGDEVHVIVICM